MNWRWKKISVVIAVVIAALLLTLLTSEIIDWARREPDWQSRSITQSLLSKLQLRMSFYEIEHGSLPGATLDDAMEQLDADKYDDEFLAGAKVKHCCDGWGRKLIYERHDPHHGVIRSVGSNGIDEKGAGDDLQIIVPNVSQYPDSGQ